MKALKLITLGMLFMLAGVSQAQFTVSLNIGTPPLWGPVGYAEARYYYLPDVEAFYDVHSSMFIYFGDGAWIHRSYLPGRYKNYDLYGGYKVVMKDYHGNTPYSHFKEYKTRYARGYHGRDQKTIGERPGHGNPRGNKPHEDNNGRHQGSHNDDRNAGHGNDKWDNHGNDKHNKDNHGKDEGGGKRK
jgi:hypothetical protein